MAAQIITTLEAKRSSDKTRRLNRCLLLHLARRAGRISRLELSNNTGLTEVGVFLGQGLRPLVGPSKNALFPRLRRQRRAPILRYDLSLLSHRAY